jgi:subtilisin family serine protease
MAFALAASSGSSEPAPDEYIVVLKQIGGNPAAVAAEHARRFGLTITHVYEHTIHGYATSLPPARTAELEDDPRVDFLSRVRPLETFAQTLPTGVNRVDADLSSALSGNGAGTLSAPAVAVIDSGVDKSHPDLNVVGGVNCSGQGGPRQWEDYSGHGTHVAGIVGARDNGIGVVGVAPGVPIYSVRVTGGRNTTAEAICGIDWVTKNAATIKVANMSLGYTTTFGWGGADDGNCGRTNQDALHLAICRSVAAGVTYVAAAGNSSVDFKNTAPAAFDEVLAVTAVADFDGQPGGGALATCLAESDDAAASFSNFTTASNSAPDADAAHTIAAPGVCIYSTAPKGGYATKSGTSMSSPTVAGAVALCLAPRPNGEPGPCAGLDPAGIVTRLRTDAAAASQPASSPYYGFAGDPAIPGSRYYGYLLDARGY